MASLSSVGSFAGRFTTPDTVKLSEIVRVESKTTLSFTLNYPPIVTSSGNPIFTFNVFPSFITSASISPVVPEKFRESVSSETLSEFTFKVEEIVAVDASVRRPCESTVNIGTSVVEPNEPGSTPVSDNPSDTSSSVTVEIIPVPPVIVSFPVSKDNTVSSPESPTIERFDIF